ncbi:flagellin [Clostridium beijerinckii]|uniref:Flagellin n=1 Tax=Clostridium beijerinckii TaxID=1520 RepID=A0AAE5H1X5_CLOBE|nr:flagellin [Clostridium beijerinckii]NSB12968.1 flagellin [Clostridium beijerinckii]OOM28757.1 flagellin [Clostridium beijerinckii]
MRLNQNMFSLNIYSSYKKSLTQNATATNNISSGLKLNKAKDNPGKIAQSETIRIQALSIEAARRNVQDTSSMLQSFDGGMQEMNDTLLRLKELAVQAGNGTYANSDIDAMKDEMTSLTDHLDKIAKTTEFNGVKLLDDTTGTGKVESAIGNMEGESTTLPKFDLTKAGLGIASIATDITNPSNVGSVIDTVDAAIKKVSSARSLYGAIQLRLEDSVDDLDSKSISMDKSLSNIADADVAEEMINFSRSQILIQSSIALMAQSNNLPKDALRVLENIK